MLNSKRSVVYLMGGFGNQVFQFSFANSLRKNGHRVLIDSSNYKKHNEGDISLREQVLPTKFFSFNEVGKITKYILIILNYLRKENFSNHIFNPLKKFNDKNYDISKESYFNYFVGYWQNPEIIESNKEFLIESLSNNKILSKSFLKKPPEGSTMIHIRRNDYVKLDEQLDIEYFTSAIKKAEMEINKFNFDVFTDDIDWVNSHEVFKKANNIFYSTNSVEDTIQTFSKMLMFENFIISNSTYSLIAALLGDKGNSYVYYPDPWFRNDYKTLELNKNWIKLANNG